ncbi:release factor H-coupled RctB family protein [Desulfatibacillum aliphaticivorans]|uniref:3'-phosphate/5'-hydroxy nucleic acid ligase n=1 Tax=Desulfatibacillum aliphaticivorans TaxID=218208 RepID=B8FHF7_DESAL|nr:RNA ligase RtcB family protein [Desulfatibacillum aliphaticivorans]ACL02245.1 release factor H-coupled RctB family protein [Desulfatibacillum aliphaticivorans]
MIILNEESPRVVLCVSSKDQVEGDALAQLMSGANLPGVVHAAGLADIHPGMGLPVGAAYLMENMVYPHIPGTDAGCGVGLWKTSLKPGKINLDRWSKKLNGLDDPWDGDTLEWLAEFGVEADEPDPGLGTIGGGNHFAELQQIDQIWDADRLKDLGLKKRDVVLVVHTGSRGLGSALFWEYANEGGAQGLPGDSDSASEFMRKHARALDWGRANRALVARRFLSCLSAKESLIADVCHNSVEKINVDDREFFLHRKGAADATQGPFVIPGSRDAFSYLVEPVGDQKENAFSLPHGAGRKWPRGHCKARLSSKYGKSDMTHTKLGGRVICEDSALLWDEAPQAYKDIEKVMQELETHDMARPIARLRPLITYKTRSKNRQGR